MRCVHFAIFDCNLQTHHVLFSVHKKVDVFWIVFSRLFHSSTKVQIVSKPFSYDPVFTECIDLCTNMLEIVAFGGNLYTALRGYLCFVRAKARSLNEPPSSI